MKTPLKLAGLIISQLFLITGIFAQSSLQNQGDLLATIVKQKSSTNTLPVGVSADWYQRSAQMLQQREYSIRPFGAEGTFATVSSMQQLGFVFTPEKYSVSNIQMKDGAPRWIQNFQFKGISRAGQGEGARPLKAFFGKGGVLEYHYSGYTIQYHNNEEGMRQNFIVWESPKGKGHVEVNLELSGDLKPSLVDGRTLVLSSADTKVAMAYDGIKVWDANQKTLDAHMELREANNLVLVVDDANAVYPITIDPLNHTPNWSDSGSGLVFSLLDDLSTPLLYGFSVSGAGDINGDGFDDVVIGAPAYVDIISVSGGTFNAASVGAAFIYYGSGSGLSATPDEVLQPTSEVGALFGFSVSNAGDVNGDGRADVVIGAPGDKINLTVLLSSVSVAVGKVYVYHSTAFDKNINTTPTVSASVSLKQSDLGTLATVPVNPLYGFSVSTAGDVNNDGNADIVVGSPAYTSLLPINLAGRVDVYHGSGTGIGSSPAKTITGGLLNGLFGFSVSTAGKVNNDDYSDIIVGAPASIGILGVGAAYVFHGSSTGITASNASSANAALNAPGLLNKTLFGYSVSNAGDVNGDGRGDVIIGEPLALDLFSGSTVAVGKAHIYYGSNSGILTSGRTQLTSPRKPGLLGLIAGNLLFGYSVSGVKDVNCDGIDDVIIGEPGGTSISLGTGLLNLVSANAVSGQAYIFYGKNSAGPIDNPGYTFHHTGGSLSAANLLGHSVKGSGDVNGDGKPDFLIGAPNGTLNLASSLTGILGNAIGYVTTNSVGTSYGYHGCINAMPLAANDNASVNEDASVTFNITANDSDPDGIIVNSTVDFDPTTSGIQNTISSNGVWTVAANGDVTYVPATNFNGPASISYVVKDNSGGLTNIATINVMVNPVNDAPVANPDNASGNEDSPVSVNVTTNDTDVDGTINKATVDLNPGLAGIQNTFTNGSGDWSVDANGVVTLTPLANSNGNATVTYTVNDNDGTTSNAATITIALAALNDAPVAVNDNATVAEDNAITVNVVANDTDVDGTIAAGTVDLDPATPGIQNAASTSPGGTWSVNGTGNLTFTPNLNFTGTASISYTVNDNSGATSGIATVNISVTPVNDAPIAVNDSPVTDEDTPITFNVTGNDTDVDGSIDVTTVDLNPSLPGIQNTITTAAGTWTVNGTGDVTFVPDLNKNGTATLTYTVNDNTGATSNPGTITVTIESINDAPHANDDVTTIAEDAVATVNITANDDDNADSDGSINPSTVDLNPGLAGIQNTISSDGTWTVNSSGSLTYTPSANFNGLASITYTVNDNKGATSNVANIKVTVTPVNDNPVAVNDAGSTNEDNPVSFSVTTNDYDVDGVGTIDVNTVDLNVSLGGIQSSASNSFGNWSVTGGTLTFTPLADYNGNASISYTVNDNSGLVSNVANVNITIAAVNDAPVAAHDNPSTSFNTPVSINVTANDTDKDGSIDPTTVDLDPTTPGVIDNTVNLGGHSWAVDATGKVTFTPAAGSTGFVAINYTVKDNSGATSNVATLTVQVFPGAAPANVAPVANNDNGSTSQNVNVVLNITANDTDSDGAIDASTVDFNPATAASDNSSNTPGVGTWNVTAGNLTFDPDPAFFGTATLSYRVKDNTGDWSGNAVISISVNAAPIAGDDTKTGNEDTQISLNVLVNDSDPGVGGGINAASVDLDPTTPGIQNTRSNGGSWSVDASGNLTFIPTPNTFGTVSISYQVMDNQGILSNIATITVDVTSVNDAPVAVNDNNSTAEDASVSFNVVANDTDADDGINVASVDLDPNAPSVQNSISNTYGSWSVSALGVVTFNPALNFNGTASVTYTVNDNTGVPSNVATISVAVSPVNDAPVAVADNPSTDEESPVVFNVTNNDTDVDGTINPATVDLNPSTPAIDNLVSNTDGTWTVAVNGNVTYTPAANVNGTKTITYTVQDDNGTTSNAATISVTVTPVNDAPVANDDIATGLEDSPVSVVVVTNDTDVDGSINPSTVDLDPATPGIQSAINTPAGTWTVDATGKVTLSPKPNFNGPATVSYTVNDNGGTTSAAATISINVTAVNDAPVAVNDNPSTIEDQVVTFSVVANDSDSDGTIDITTVDLNPATPSIETTLSTSVGNWVVLNGAVTLTPEADFNGTASITYTVNDNSGTLSNVATIAVLVTSLNDAPIAIADVATTAENTSVTVNITSNDTDVDGSINAASTDLDPAAAGIQTTRSTTKGTWIIAVNGDLTFTPVTGFNGTTSINYVVADNNGLISNEASVTVTVNWVNDAPVANDDNGTTPEHVAITIAITSNDVDIDGSIDVSSIHLDPVFNTSGRTTMDRSEGTWTVNDNGEVTFIPADGFTGVVSVGYRVTDDLGMTSNEGLITINVVPVHNIVTGLAKSVSTPELLNDGRMRATFVFTVESFSTMAINNIQVTDDLNAAFPNSIVEVEKGSATGGLIYNSSYDGVSDVNLLAAGSSIGAGETQQIRITAIVHAQGKPGVFSNSAKVTTKSDDGTSTYSDISDEGTNPDENSNGNPSDLDESDATTIDFPISRKLSVTKMLSSDPVKNNDCTYSVWFHINIKNAGNVDFTDIKAIDNIGHGIVAPSGYLIADLSSDKLNVNHGFDGKTNMNLLANGNMLAYGDSAVIDYVVTIIPNDFYGPYSNTVEVQATAADGIVIEHASTPVNFEIVPQEVFIPEGFSPNNDGNHDKFEITLSCGLTARLTVFNRWGQEVYHSNNYQNDWDGTSNATAFMGKLLPEGTYFYKIALSSGTKTTSFITIKH